MNNKVKEKFSEEIAYINLKEGEYSVNISCYAGQLANSTVIIFSVKNKGPEKMIAAASEDYSYLLLLIPALIFSLSLAKKKKAGNCLNT